MAIGTLLDYPPLNAIRITEFLRNASWLMFLAQLRGLQIRGFDPQNKSPEFSRSLLVAIGLGGCLVLLPALQDWGALPAQQVTDELVLIVWLLSSIAGLYLIEQIYRNASTMELWGLKYILLGLGIAFAYDFFMYAEALLFRQLQPELWQARGLVNAIIAPWLAISITRNRQWRVELYVSREVVFHTVTLVGAGLYLVGMAIAGYGLQYVGGDWGGVLQVSFTVTAAVVLGSLLLSTSLRAKLRVYISKNFFRNRYDYREEWRKFTEGLSDIKGDLGLGILQNIAPIVLSEGGALYSRDGAGAFYLSANWRMEALNEQPTRREWQALCAWLERTRWVVDLHQWRREPAEYEGLALPLVFSAASDAWLVVPLMFQKRLEGVVLIRKTPLKSELMWEDHDLLKTVGLQAASYLAQARTSNDLMEIRQFDAFNRLSAYVVHDLKNILAQQSLLVANAKKHRDNPAFIDDMISTVNNSVVRMQRLMEQMRSGERTSSAKVISIASLLEDVIRQRSCAQPVPQNAFSEVDAFVRADPERLTTVFCHLVQNAQEAIGTETPKGMISLEISKSQDNIKVTVTDNGAGMSDEFIREKLFKPFESTKGLTGMGIGVFESREYVRQIGGDVTVSSVQGQGSVFEVTLPTVDLEPSSDSR